MNIRIWLLFSVINLTLFAQRGLIQYSKENGLISNEIRNLAYDREGFIWLATPKGIERFDGQRFIHFRHDPVDSSSIASNDIQGLVFDKNQTIWAFTYNKGLIAIQTKTFAVTNYNKRTVSSFGSNRTTALTVQQNRIWYTSAEGKLYLFDTESRKTKSFLLPGLEKEIPILSEILIDKADPGKLWITSSEGLYLFSVKTQKWKRYQFNRKTDSNPGKTSAYRNEMTSLVQDSKRNLFIGLRRGGVLYFNQSRGLFCVFPISVDELKYQAISSIEWRDQRYLYLCLLNKEILLFDTSRKEYVRYEEAERSVVMPRRITKFGSQLAIASSNAGLFVHDEALIYGTKVKTDQRLQNVRYSSDKKRAYQLLGSTTPLLKRIYGNGPELIRLNGVTDAKCFYFLQNGNILVVGANGVVFVDRDYRIARKMIHSDHRPIDHRFQNSLLVGDSLLFVGTLDASLLRIRLKDFSSEKIYEISSETKSDETREYFPLAMIQAGDEVYFSENEQLYRYGIRSGKVKQISLFNHENTDQIICLAVEDQQKLWIGTRASGVWSYGLETKQLKNEYTSFSGLQNDEVSQLILDKRKWLWVLNPSCVAIVNTTLRKVRSLEKRNGVSDIFRINITPDSIYFLQWNSYIVSAVGSKLPARKAASPYIMQIREMNGLGRFSTNKLRYAYFENNLIFEFGVKDFSNVENNMVSYRMLGLNPNWINGNQKTEALYHNLPSGKYVFQVQVSEGDESRIMSYSFEITKPFWLHWWFIILSSVIIACGIWYYMRSRIRRIQSTEQMKAEFSLQINELESRALRAQMNPHFLFNSLNSIRLFILKNEVDNAADYIAKFSKLLRMILNYSRQDMITVYDEIQSLKLYLEFERLRFGQDFDFDLQIDGQEVLDCQIPPMIIQPFIENAIWHGLMPRTEEGGRIRVSFQKQQSGLYVMVQDNGIGREKARENNRKRSLKEGSVGLQITKDRLRSLTLRTKRQNEFEIEDLTDKNGEAIGTLVTLHFETPN
ncbi:histidine kinase [Fluviicola sp.]|jgi:ligand-binding sensor domain-containing protein|uniref:sensor histidine kinase n=1 Tax=Fluviicola sp. TaxID=1917219 RepID=UPI00282FEDB3|nr:histidine kinase [Fluviicola sp.]MDR0801210.1 histidine kinase [Fluviicola sp.]